MCMYLNSLSSLPSPPPFLSSPPLLSLLSLQLLLQYGADPELRDDDSQTALMKAQERDDEWHKQCIEILEHPGQPGQHR